PQDPAVQEALRIIRERLAPPEPPAPPAPQQPTAQQHQPEAKPSAPAQPAAAPTNAQQPASVRAQPAAEPTWREPHTYDPANLFAPRMRGGQLLGALLVDNQGLVLAGSLQGDLAPYGDALGAIIGGAIEEAARTAQHLSLGQWQGVLVEAETAVLHFAPVNDGQIVLLAARRNAP